MHATHRRTHFRRATPIKRISRCKSDSAYSVEKARRCRALASFLLLAAVAVAVPGCGGGDANDDDKATDQPVQCADHPESCK